MMDLLLVGVVLAPAAFLLYAYMGYPLVLRLFGAFRPPVRPSADPREWPRVTVTVPVYNEEANIRAKLEGLLQLDYPSDRLHVLVISDASTDGTDRIVSEFADRGVELLRLPARGGKTAAENAAGARLQGEIVVNSDATVSLRPHSLKELVRVFQDPTVGVASGRDISVGNETVESNGGESGYVGYEMKVRALETRLGSIVGASGCFYAIRRSIYNAQFPEELSRDFASALMAWENGYRAVSVESAVCLVPRTTSLQTEYRRKIRTMARGLQTLWYKRHLLNPLRYGQNAAMLFSHKLCRWLVPLSIPPALLALAVLSFDSPVAAAALGLVSGSALLGWIGMRSASAGPTPAWLAAAGFLLASNLAGILAWMKVLRGRRSAVWEPTRRPVRAR